MMIRLLLLLGLAFHHANGFAPPTVVVSHRHHHTTAASCASSVLVIQQKRRPTSSSLNAESSGDDNSSTATKKSGKKLDDDMKTKLLAESIAPWRTVRLFMYGSLGSGALLGGLVTLSGVAAALSGARTDVDMNTEYLNLAIDFGAVLVFALLFKFDLGKSSELTENVEKKLESKKDQKNVVQAMRKRESKLKNLNLSVQVSLEGDRQESNIQTLQEGAKQHVIVVIGNRKAIVQALLGARLQKQEFALQNLLVVPYQTDINMQEQTRQAETGGGSGFDTNKKKGFEDEPFVAKPTGDGWDEYIQEELNDAIKQNGEKVKDDGIVVVLSNKGKVIRRGVGKIPWRMIVDELAADGNKKEKETGGGIEIPFLSSSE